MPLDSVVALLETAMGAPAGSLSMDDVMEGQWESVSLLGFMAAVDEEFNVVLSPAKLMACRTVADVVTLVRGAS